VALSWTPSASGGSADFYVVEAGSAPSLINLAQFSTGSPSPGYAASGVPPGVYYIRVRAGNAFGVSGASNEVALQIGGRSGTDVPPGAPMNLQAIVNLSNVTLTWTPPTSGGLPTTYIVEAGSAPSLSNVANVAIPSSVAGFATTGVPAGVYYVRVRAANGWGIGAASNEVVVIVQN
jgi:predicted phage tail protein